MIWLIFLLLTGSVFAQKVEQVCSACHQEQVADFGTHPHSAKGLSCDACHGKSEKHAQAAGGAAPDRVAAPDEQPALCGNCHVGQRKEFELSQHAKVLLAKASAKAPACGTCHGTHTVRAAKQLEAQCSRCHTTLPPSCKAAPLNANAKVSCAGCHSPHSMQVAKRN